MLDFAILGLLRDEARHGYELRRALAELGFWKVSFGSLYPALRRLEKRGLIAAGRGEGRRRSYRITVRGSDEFAAQLAEPPKATEVERNFQLRLAFFEYLDARLRIRTLEDRRGALLERLRGARRSFLRARRVEGGTDRYRLALMERSVRSTEADIAWLDELIATERSAGAGA